MKLSEIKKQIEEAIIEILSEEVNEITTVTKQTKPSEIPVISKSEEVPPQTVSKAIARAKASGQDVDIAEAEEDEFDAPEKEPSKAELKKIDKEFGSSKLAKKLSPEEKERLNRIEAGIKKKLANPTKENIDIIKSLINKADIKKLFKDGGKDLKALVSDIIK